MGAGRKALVVAAIAGFSQTPTSTARAELWATSSGAPPTLVEHRVVLVVGAGRQTTQETLVLEGTGRRFARFVPYPSTPSFPPPVESLESSVTNATARAAPARFGIRDDAFGPSFVGRFLGPDPEPEPTPSPEAAPVQMIGRASFRGEVPTSTVTKSPVLPLALQGFTNRYQLGLDRRVAAAIARYMNAGWVVVGTVYEPARSATRLRLGPLRADFDTEVPRLTLPSAVPDPTVELHVVGEGPLVPIDVPFAWSDTPWSVDDPAAGSARGFGRHVWTVDEQGVAPWIGAGVVTNRAVDDVVHLRFRPAREPYRDLRLGPAGDVPRRPRRGTPADVWLTILFGVTPVFAAPESWILAFVQSRARKNARPTRTSWLTRIWFVWPLIVGVYWIVSGQGLARWAATIPLLLGLLLLRPFTAEHHRFVRARIEKKKKATS